MNLRGLSLYIVIVTALPTILSAQDSPAAAPSGLSAREIFYLPGPAPAAKAPSAKATSSPKKSSAPVTPGKAVETVRDSDVPVNATNPRPARVPSSVQASMVNAADHPARALGVRYTIEKVTAGSAEPMGIHSVFHSGDRIRVSVEVNDTAYLYVVARGSSGTWSPLFPSKNADDGSNRVEPGRKYVVPTGKGQVFTFHEPSGAEKLFIVASRVPEPSLEQLMYAIHSGQGGSPSTPAQTSSDPNVKILMASAEPIGDRTVGDLRAYSRDLIVEDASAEAQPDHSGTGQDKSFYAVNPSGSPDSRVVADITLNHQ
jgi:hypothetical protein